MKKNLFSRSSSLLLIALGLLALVPARADQNLAGNVTITGGASGNLNVTGAIDSDGNTFTFGTQTGSFGGSLLYQDNSVDTLIFGLNRTPASWLWQHSAAIKAMRLDSAHQLILYRADGSTAGLTFTPQTGVIKFGTHANATLTGNDSTGVITSAGGMNVTGAFTASSGITNTSGTLTGGVTGLNLSAGGSNQNITLNSSGTGDLVFNTNGVERARIKASGSFGIGTTNPGSKLEINGGSLSVKSATSTFGSLSLNPGGSGYAGYIDWYKNGPTRIAYLGYQDLSGSQNNLGLNLENSANFIIGGGNVGIGTISAPGKLNIAGDQFFLSGATALIGTYDAQDLRLLGSAAAGSAGKGVFIDYYNQSTWYKAVQIKNTAGGFGNLLLMQDGGNVGLGTTTPSSRLDIVTPANGSGRIRGLSAVHVANNTIQIDQFGQSHPNRPAWNIIGVSNAEQNLALVTDSQANIDSGTSLQGIFIKSGGNVGIGTINPTHKLAVNGTIRAKEVIVDTGWADYVFEESYRLAPLSEVESHIRANKHLPGIPSAAEVAEHGVSMGDMQAKLLSKVEELTLHLIAQEKRMLAQQTAHESEMAALRQQMTELKASSIAP